MASPTFFLYGDPPRVADRNFLHLEPLDARSRPANWHIRPHRHADLHHIFMLSSGAGEMRAGGTRITVAAPCLLLVPAGLEHAFSFVPDTTGRVLTVAGVFLDDVCRIDPSIAPPFAAPRALGLGAEAAPMLACLDRLARELAWHAPGHAAAVKATLLQILVAITRLQNQGVAQPGVETSDTRLVARFRELVEARFRTHAPIASYAAALGVSLSRLRVACRTQGSGAPLAVLNARRMLEAKRALLYSPSSVAEVAFALGYDDVSYFIRLFRRLEGLSPRAFRQSLSPTSLF